MSSSRLSLPSINSSSSILPHTTIGASSRLPLWVVTLVSPLLRPVSLRLFLPHHTPRLFLPHDISSCILASRYLYTTNIMTNATPVRKFFIIYVARELRLIFPTPSATAVTIRSMHLAAGGEALAKLKMRALSGAFAGAFVLRVVSQYAIGILWDWHVATWLLIWGGYHNHAIQIENWGWLIEWTPAFIGTGMLVGLNVAISFFAGTVFSWGIVGPSLVATGAAFGKHPITNTSELYPHWHGYVNYFSLSGTAASKNTPSPRYWLLWPGVLAMLTISMVELACQWRVFWFASKAITRGLAKASSDMMAKTGRSNAYLAEKGRQDEAHLVKDSASEDEQVKLWMWVPGLIAIIVLACVVMGTLYGMPVGESLLALFLAFFFSFMAIQCTGATDITPLTAASKSSQIILGGATKGEHWGIERAQRLNLLGGALASIGANQSADLVGDFRVGFLLRTPPKIQWVAQGIFSCPASERHPTDASRCRHVSRRVLRPSSVRTVRKGYVIAILRPGLRLWVLIQLYSISLYPGQGRSQVRFLRTIRRCMARRHCRYDRARLPSSQVFRHLRHLLGRLWRYHGSHPPQPLGWRARVGPQVPPQHDGVLARCK